VCGKVNKDLVSDKTMPHRILSGENNVVLAALGSIPSTYAFVVEQTPAAAAWAIATPFILFILGKLADYIFQILKERREQKRKAKIGEM
jgi:hypothetical protein